MAECLSAYERLSMRKIFRRILLYTDLKGCENILRHLWIDELVHRCAILLYTVYCTSLTENTVLHSFGAHDRT